jgi:hypothetical protein
MPQITRTTPFVWQFLTVSEYDCMTCNNGFATHKINLKVTDITLTMLCCNTCRQLDGQTLLDMIQGIRKDG